MRCGGGWGVGIWRLYRGIKGGEGNGRGVGAVFVLQ